MAEHGAIQSGTDSRKERAAFEQMLVDARKGLFDVIVAYRPDRLFRSLWAAARLKQVMDETGVEVETVALPMDKKTLGLWAWVAEQEIENIRERTMMGREAMARAGKLVTGNPPYGFQYDRSIKQLQHRDNEKTRVLELFDWVAQGKSIQSLTNNFNRLGILTRNGKPWSRQQILKILSNPIYVGRAYWGKRERRNGAVVVAKKSAAERILIPVTPIVSEEVFQKVQRQLEKNRVISPRNTKQIYLLQHLLHCRVCGRSFHARCHCTNHGKPLKTPERYYGCRGMQQSPGAYHCRRPAEFYAPTLENVVWDEVAQAFADPKALIEMLKVRNAAATDKAMAIQTEVDLAKEQMKKKQLELQQVLTWARQSLLTGDELEPQLAEARNHKQQWEREVEKLTQKLGSLQAGDGDLADAEQTCKLIRGRLGKLTLQEKKDFLRLVVERIWVDENNNLDIEVIVPRFDKVSNGVNCETAHSSTEERGKLFLERGAKPFLDTPRARI